MGLTGCSVVHQVEAVAMQPRVFRLSSREGLQGPELALMLAPRAVPPPAPRLTSHAWPPPPWCCCPQLARCPLTLVSTWTTSWPGHSRPWDPTPGPPPPHHPTPMASPRPPPATIPLPLPPPMMLPTLATTTPT